LWTSMINGVLINNTALGKINNYQIYCKVKNIEGDHGHDGD